MITTYSMYIQTFLKVDEDSKGLYVEVPGMSENWFKVRCVESKTSVYASHCSCSKFAHKQSCEHVEIVQSFWNRIYKTSIAKASEKALEQAMDASDAIEQSYEEVAISEQIIICKKDQTPLTVVPAPVATPPKVPVLNGQSQSAQMPKWLSILPSRQVVQKIEVFMDHQSQVEEAKKEILFEEKMERHLVSLKKSTLKSLKALAESREVSVAGRLKQNYIDAILDDIRREQSMYEVAS